jgi:hypothetical protein
LPIESAIFAFDASALDFRGSSPSAEASGNNVDGNAKWAGWWVIQEIKLICKSNMAKLGLRDSLPDPTARIHL